MKELVLLVALTLIAATPVIPTVVWILFVY